MFSKAFVLLATVIAFALPSRSRAADIFIAARDDVRPFIWMDQSTRNYRGFFWDICNIAVIRAGYVPVQPQEPITAAQREDFLEGKLEKYDLLCDPTTITLYRMRKFLKQAPYLAFSPIVFVANGTYAEPRVNSIKTGSGKLPTDLRGPKAACGGLLNWEKGAAQNKEGMGEQSDQGAWITFLPPQIKPSKVDNKEDYQIWGYLDGSTIGKKLKQEEDTLSRDGNVLICLDALPSHKEAAEKFCTGRLARYYGDAEIIQAAIQAYKEEKRKTCDFTVAKLSTYEPYAFVTSSRNSEFPQKFALSLYTMFADQTIEGLFAAHFRETKSEFLTTLFRINNIPAGPPLPPPLPMPTIGEQSPEAGSP